MLIAFLVVPFLDSMICSDCRGGVPFSGEEISHLESPHSDVIPSVGNGLDQADGSSPGKETDSICSICVNIAAGNYASHFEPLHYVGSEITQLTHSVPSEPSFSIHKPPQNSLTA